MNKRHKWTNKEIEILKKYYPDYGIYKCMEMLPYLTKSQIKTKIVNSKDISSNNFEKWTKDETNKLIQLWPKASKNELLNAFPNRTYQKIQSRAHFLKLKCEIERNRKSNLNFLKLENLNPQSAYWWGFIMADGHISKRYSLIITLSKKDKDHLQKLASKINGKLTFIKKISSFTNKESEFVNLTASDKKILTNCMTILNMKETAKTYFPPTLDVFNEYFIYFFLGFVDGDGSIWLSKNYPQLKIENHISWKENFEKFANILKNKFDIKSVVVKTGKKGTAILTIANRDDIIQLSTYCQDVDFLRRKWNKILNYKSNSSKN